MPDAPRKSVDFAAVLANAAADGIPTSDIAVIYEDLTAMERLKLREAGLVAMETEGKVIARLVNDGNQPFAEKATGVRSLSA